MKRVRICGLLVCLISVPVWAESDIVERRIGSLDSLAASEQVQSANPTGMSMMLSRVNSLQTEVQELRGQVELLTFELQRMKQSQKDRYVDLDGRLNQLETGQVATASNNKSAAVVITPVPGIKPIARRAVVDSVAEKEVYTSAFKLLKNRDFQAAEKAFVEFLGQFPDGEYADNAQYWLAETQYVQNNLEASMNSFKLVLAGFPNSAKIPDAKLKMGYIYVTNGQVAEAKEILNEVIASSSPRSSKVRLAKAKLKEIEKQQ
jgi:tol-pal system protein YbgF